VYVIDLVYAGLLGAVNLSEINNFTTRLNESYYRFQSYPMEHETTPLLLLWTII
jgi:hypothetical protein